MSKTLSNGFSIQLAVNEGQRLRTAWRGGSYSATIVAGGAGQIALATNAITDNVFGPYTGGRVIRLTCSAIGSVDYEVGYAAAIRSESDGLEIIGAPGLGNVLSAVFTGQSTGAVQWYRDVGAGPVAISGATSLTYTQQAADIAPAGTSPYIITCRSTSITLVSNGLAAPYVALPSGTGAIGPYAVGASLVRSGNTYTVADGDDFDGVLDIVTPATPNGKYHTTRAYIPAGSAGQNPRFATSLLALKMYDVDSGHTGFDNSGRGNVPASWSDALTQSGGRLRMKSRIATTPEKALFYQGAVQDILGEMVNTGGSLTVMAPFYVETKFNRSAGGAAHGTHFSFWMEQMYPIGASDGLEIDWEGTGTDVMYPNYFRRAGGVSVESSLGTPVASLSDGQDHVYGLEITAAGTIRWWFDGAIVRTATPGALDITLPFYIMLSNHVADFTEDPYVLSNWTALGANGYNVAIDYLMVARSGANSYTPALPNQTYNVDFGTAFSVVLPSATALWGSAVSEYTEAIIQESNEPGGNSEGGYYILPAGVSYDSATFTLSGTITDKSGTLHLSRYCRTAGNTTKPWRFALNVGPSITSTAIAAITQNVAYSFDLYAVSRCGQLTTNAAGVRTNTISVTGLPTGLSYSDTTGLITGTATSVASGNISVTVTNSIGQVLVKSLSYSVVAAGIGIGIAPPVISGNPALAWDFDFNDSTKVAVTSGSIDSVTSKGTSAIVLANTSTARPTQEVRAGKNAARFTSASSQFLQLTGLSLTPGGTLVAIVDHATAGVNQVLFEKALGSATTSLNRDQLIGINASSHYMRKGNATVFQDAVAVGGFTTGLALVIGRNSTGDTQSVIWRNGAAGVLNATGSVADGSTQDSVTLGARRGAGAQSLYMDGWGYRYLYYPSGLTSAQTEEIAVWAANQYGTANVA